MYDILHELCTNHNFIAAKISRSLFSCNEWRLLRFGRVFFMISLDSDFAWLICFAQCISSYLFVRSWDFNFLCTLLQYCNFCLHWGLTTGLCWWYLMMGWGISRNAKPRGSMSGENRFVGGEGGVIQKTLY